MRHIVNRIVILTLLVSALLLQARVTRAQAGITDDEIKSILRDRIDVAKKSVGIVVGLVDEKGVRIISYGKASQNSEQMVNGDSVFEIGSVTKVFTATLLADMVERGQVSLNDPISKYLPRSVKTPTRNGKEITLLDLSSQTSGLPRMPGNFTPRDVQNPYADYSVAQMYEFISGYTLTRDIGAKYEYSNLGVGLLGHILALRAGKDYETLVRTRICSPLKMNSTRITLTPAMQARLATGHNPVRLPVPNWDLPTLAGAGALRSTVNDMLKFVAANLGLKKSPLLAAMQKTHQSRHNTGVPDLESLYVEYHYGHGDGIKYVNGYKSKVRNRQPIIGERGINYSPTTEDQYFKGALFLNTLRSIVDDDKRWWALLHDFYQHFKYQNIMTEDVVAYFNRKTRRNLTPIFDQYLRHTSLPLLELKFTAGAVSYKWKADEPAFAMPVSVGTKDHWQIIQPTTQWQTMKTPLTKDEFQVATDLYFVEVSKS